MGMGPCSRAEQGGKVGVVNGGRGGGEEVGVTYGGRKGGEVTYGALNGCPAC